MIEIVIMAFVLGMFAGFMIKHIWVESERTDQRIKDLVWWDVK